MAVTQLNPDGTPKTQQQALPPLAPYDGAPVNTAEKSVGGGLGDAVAPINPITKTPTATPTTAPPAPPLPNTYSASNNLISSQINPSPTTATPPNTNFGSGAVTAGPTINPNIQSQGDPSSDSNFQNYTSGYNNALNNISNGPNRTQMALTALQDFDTAGQPQLEAGYRRVGQKAAALGRLGAGMTTNDLTGLSATYQRDRSLAARGLARDVAEGDINDRFRTADLYGNARGQQYGFGQDQRNYLTDLASGNYGRANNERNYTTGVDQYNQGAAFDRQRASNDYQSQYADQLFGQNRANANDLRGERDFQTGRSDKAQQDAINQKMMEDALLNSSFGRASSRLNAGSAGNPSGAYQDAANQMSGDASQLMAAGGGLLTQGNTRQPAQPDYSSLIQQLLGLQGGQ